MAATKYTYSIASDFLNAKVDTTKLSTEVQASAIVTAYDYTQTNEDVCDIWFKDALSTGDETILDGLVAAHDGIALPSDVINVSSVQDARYRLNLLTEDQDLPKTTWTTIYVYEGSGYLYSFWTDVNANNIDLEVEFDGVDVIIPSINLNDVSGFGGSGQATMMPLIQLGTSNFAFNPQEKIRFNSKIEIKMKTSDSASGVKKLLKGYVSLVKET